MRFADFANLRDEEIDLARAVLSIAVEECGELDVDGSVRQLDALAAAVRDRWTPEDGPLARVLGLSRFLFEECGFVGNRVAYTDPRNSYLHEVLERRTGIPISLAVVYMEVARRAGLEIAGVSFPQHFLMKAVADPSIVIDPFTGDLLTRVDCESRLRDAMGPEAELGDGYLETAGPREILVRMLTNLKLGYFHEEQYERSIGCSDRILLLTPDAPFERRDRGLAYLALECFGPALADLEVFMETCPDRRAKAALEDTLESLRVQAAQVH